MASAKKEDLASNALTPPTFNHASGLQDINMHWEAPADASGHELTARYVPLKVGSYLVSVTHRGTHIKGSPWPLTVAPAAGRAAHSALLGVPSFFTVSQPVAISLQAKDAFGNATSGGDTVVIIADSATEGEAVYPASPVVRLAHFNQKSFLSVSIGLPCERSAWEGCLG